MPNWKFWEKPQTESPIAVNKPVPRTRFGIQPRTDMPGFGKAIDPNMSDQFAKLRRRRETVLFDVEQAELANAPENPWQERIKLLDEALIAVRAEFERANSVVELPGTAFPAMSVEAISATDGPPPSVSFRVGLEEFRYEEEQDWAERGFQLARGELQLVSGDPSHLLGAEAATEQFEARLEQLTASLFVFASDIRDRSLEGQTLTEHVTVADLATPDTEHGGWRDWKGHSTAKARQEARLHELHAEEQRLLESRARELEDLAKWENRLPIARRRLTDVDAEIAALGG